MKLLDAPIVVANALLEPLDALIVWAWDEFGVDRKWFIRAPMLVSIVCYGAVGAFGGAAFIAFWLLVEEWARRMPAAAWNAYISATRPILPFALLRLSGLGLITWSTLATLATGKPIDVTIGVLGLAYILLSGTFRPDRPRKPRRELKLALAGGRA